MFTKFSLRLKLVALSCFLTLSTFATDYTFTGNGDWKDPNNWLNNLVPPSTTLNGGNTIIIQGTTASAPACPGNCPPAFCSTPCPSLDNLSMVYGTLIIAAGGQLTLQNWAQFGNAGTIIVHGTLINRTTYEGYSIGSLTIYGSVINRTGGGYGIMGNQAVITINTGGTLRNETGLLNNDMSANKGTIILNGGAKIENLATFHAGKINNNGGVIVSASTLTGNSTITGSLINSGLLAPGNSPGAFSVSGNYTATSSSVHQFEVGGVDTSAYDRLLVGDTAHLGGALNVTAINGFVPTANNPISIITGTIRGTFSTVSIPSNLIMVYNANSVQLKLASTLPVRFLSLTAAAGGTGTRLHWRVAGEHNVLHYEVERSSDGRIFSIAGSVTASQRSGYDFTDGFQQAKVFYRIKSVDADGSHKYSTVIQFDGGKGSALTAYPMPAAGLVQLQHGMASKTSKITITSIEGVVMHVIQPKEGSRQTAISTASLATGVYLIRFGNRNNEAVIKFIRQ